MRRTVLASVLTPTGQPVADVPASSFRGTFHGKPVRVLSATRDLGPRRIVVLLDASASMLAGGGKWQFARRAVGDMLNALPAKDQIALLVFAAKVDAVVGFSEGRQAITDRVAALEVGRKVFPKGSRQTALLDAMLEGLSLLQPAQKGDVIYLISDGGDNASRANPNKVEQALLAAGVRLFMLFLPETPMARALMPSDLSSLEVMQELVQHTCGNILNPERSRQFWRDYNLDEKEQAAFNFRVKQLHRQMSQFYLQEVELPVPVDKPREWKLEMVDARGDKSKEWHATYQRILLPCSAPTSQK